MVPVLTVAIILFSLANSIAVSSGERSRNGQGISNRRSKTLCSNPNSCAPLAVNRKPSETRKCSRKTDCLEGEYCHPFHRLCLTPLEPGTVAPVRTSARRCKDDSNCNNREYCHELWKICLQPRKVFRDPPSKRPSWYCESFKDCRINQHCHKRFHTCYKRPRTPTRHPKNSPKCRYTSECRHNYYCHEVFQICLPRTTTARTQSNRKSRKFKICDSDGGCRTGMMCHRLWRICFTPARNLTVKTNKTRQCQSDSDCRKDKFCHIMGDRGTAVIARHRRNVHSVCLPLRFKQTQTPRSSTRCTTDAECGPNKCCLEKLGICSAHQLPGDMCLQDKTDFVCPCASGSYCRPRGKSASPKRIINKMKLPKSIADYLMSNGRRRKYKIGKCIPRPLN